MSALLALYTCHTYDYTMHGMVSYPKRPKLERRPAIKATWLKDVDVDFKWFFGSTDARDPDRDEVFLTCNDGYYYLPHKTQAIARWAIAHGYDRVFKVDDDTFIYWDRFKNRPGFADAEYSGGCWPESSYAYGGAYAIAGRMLEAVASTPIPSGTWGEDAWVGDVAKANGIPFVRDDTFHYGKVDPRTNIQIIGDDVLRGNHYSVLNPLSPEQMLRYYREGPP